MNEIFKLYRGSFSLNGAFPLLVTTAGSNGANDVTGIAILFSRFPNGEYKMIRRTENMRGRMGDPLPNYNWTQWIADDAGEWVTDAWMSRIAAANDSFWAEYLTKMGRLNWIELENPESQLLHYVLRTNDSLVDEIAGIGRHLPSVKAKEAFQQAISFRQKVILTGE